MTFFNNCRSIYLAQQPDNRLKKNLIQTIPTNLPSNIQSFMTCTSQIFFVRFESFCGFFFCHLIICTNVLLEFSQAIHLAFFSGTIYHNIISCYPSLIIYNIIVNAIRDGTVSALTQFHHKQVMYISCEYVFLDGISLKFL